LSQQKNSKRGKVALILGNGPSIKKLDLKNVEKMQPDIFVTNAYYSTSLSQLIKPNYYCLSDPAFFFDNGGVAHSISETLKYISDSRCTLLVSHLYRKVSLEIPNEVLFFNDLDLSAFSKNINPCKPRGYASQTLMKALSVAIFLGYDRIYLIGVDNTEHRALFGDKSNNLWARTDLYYGTSIENRLDYQIPQVSGIASTFFQYATWFSDYHKFAVGNVFNLDEVSLVDAFPKVERIV